MDELIKKAKKLGLTFDEDSVTEDELKSLIEDAEKKAADDEKNKSNDASFYKAEMEKAIKKRDDIKKERRELAKKVKQLEEGQKGLPSSDEINELKTQLDELKSFKDEIDELEKEKQRQEMDKEERLKLKFQEDKKALESDFSKQLEEREKEAEEIRKRTEELQSQVESLRVSRLESEVVKVAAKLNAFSPEQVAKLVKEDFEYDKDLNRYVRFERDSSGKLVKEYDVEEYVTEYLGKEENENLVRSNVNKSSMHTNKNTKSDDNKHKTGKYNPTDPDIVAAAEREDMEPDRYIKYVLEPRDKYKERQTNKNE